MRRKGEPCCRHGARRKHENIGDIARGWATPEHRTYMCRTMLTKAACRWSRDCGKGYHNGRGMILSHRDVRFERSKT
jgi:hypothetical protein